jgi:hypothetical protein
LSKERDGFLFQLLRVTNVAIDNFGKRKGFGVVGELITQFFGTDGDFSTNGIFDSDNVWVDLR